MLEEQLKAVSETPVSVTKDGRAYFRTQDLFVFSSDEIGKSDYAQNVRLYGVFYDGEVYVLAASLCPLFGKKTQINMLSSMYPYIRDSKKFRLDGRYTGQADPCITPYVDAKGQPRGIKAFRFIRLEALLQLMDYRKRKDFKWAQDKGKAYFDTIQMAGVKYGVSEQYDTSWMRKVFVTPDGYFTSIKPGNKPTPRERRLIRKLILEDPEYWESRYKAPNLLRPEREVPLYCPANRKNADPKIKLRRKRKEPQEVRAIPVESEKKEPEKGNEVTIHVPKGTIVHIVYDS